MNTKLSRRSFIKAASVSGVLATTPFVFSGCGNDYNDTGTKETHERVTIRFDHDITHNEFMQEINASPVKDKEYAVIKKVYGFTSDGEVENFIASHSHDTIEMLDDEIEFSHIYRHPLVKSEISRSRAVGDTSTHETTMDAGTEKAQLVRVFNANPSADRILHFLSDDVKTNVPKSHWPKEIMYGTYVHIPGREDPTMHMAVHYARSLIFQHPDLMQEDPVLAKVVMDIIVNQVPHIELANALKDSIIDHTKDPYYKIEVPRDENGEIIYVVDSGTNEKTITYIYKMTNTIDELIKASVQEALNLAHNHPNLKEVLFNDKAASANIENDQRSVSSRMAMKKRLAGEGATDTQGNSFDFAADYPEWENGYRLDLFTTGKARTIGLNYFNSYNRYLMMYARFYDNGGVLIEQEQTVGTSLGVLLSAILESKDDGIAVAWSAFRDEISTLADDADPFDILSGKGIKCIGLNSPADFCLGIPIPDGETNVRTELTIPDNATKVVILGGGLGVPTDSDFEAEWLGIALTAIVNIAMPTWSLMADTPSTDNKEVKYTIWRIIKEDVTAIYGILNFIYQMMNGSTYGKLSGIATLAESFGALLMQPFMRPVHEYLLKKAATEKAIEMMPIIGMGLHIMGIVGSVAMISTTIAAASMSPSTYRREITVKHDIKVVISHALDNIKFPATATKYIVIAQFGESMPQKSPAVSMGGTTRTDDIEYTFTGVPSGGRVSITALFLSDTNWIAGQGEAEFDNFSDTPGMLTLPITIIENLVPLSASTRYNWKQRLDYNTMKGYFWIADAKPTETRTVLDVNAGNGNLGSLTSITYNQKNGALGYSWQAYSSTVQNKLTNSSNAQLHMFRNVSAKENANLGKKFSGFGFPSPTPMNYNPLGVADWMIRLTYDAIINGVAGSKDIIVSYAAKSHEMTVKKPLDITLEKSPYWPYTYWVATLDPAGVYSNLVVSDPTVATITLQGNLIVITPTSTSNATSELDNYVVLPKTINGETLYYVRRVDVTEDSDSFNINYDENWGIFPFPLNNVVLHAYRYLIGVNSQLSRIFILKLPEKATPDSKQRQYEIVTPKIVAAKALDNAGHIHNPALLYNPKNLAVSKDGHIFILDEVAKLPGVDANVTARVKTINLKGQSVNFYKDSSGNAINYINLKEEARSITYLDISVETQNHMYILAYLGDGSRDEDYVVDVYDPRGAHLSRTTGVVAGKLTVDKWRSIYTLNYQTISGENGVTEPTISEWIPSTPEG